MRLYMNGPSAEHPQASVKVVLVRFHKRLLALFLDDVLQGRFEMCGDVT